MLTDERMNVRVTRTEVPTWGSLKMRRKFLSPWNVVVVFCSLWMMVRIRCLPVASMTGLPSLSNIGTRSRVISVLLSILRKAM